MYAIFKKEMKDRKISLFMYCFGALALLWLYVAVFPSIEKSSAQFEEIIKAYPKEFLQAFGIEDLSFNTLEKYVAAEQYSFMWPILVIILMLSRAGNYIAGEVERRTMGLLLSLPVSRAKIFLGKYLAGLATLLIFVIISVLGIIPIAEVLGVKYDAARHLNLSYLCFFFGWVIFSLSMLASSFFSDRGKPYFIMSGLLVVSYAINIIAGVQDNLDWLQYFSIFHYFGAQDVLGKNEISLTSYWVFGSVIITSTLLGLYRFIRRDVSV